jgi:Ca-activated chloride channel homolog
MSPADLKLDAQLRNVRVPDGLLDRLMALPVADDDSIDELVREVDVPPDLVQWLQAIPLSEDAGLDEALRNVSVPASLVNSCRHPRSAKARSARRRMDYLFRMSGFTMAASLILAVSLSLGSAMLLKMIVDHSGDQLPASSIVDKDPAPPVKPKTSLESSWGMLANDRAREGELAYQRGEAGREVDLADLEPAAAREARDRLNLDTLPGGADPLALSAGVLVSPNSWDELPDLPRRPVAPLPHGLDWPLDPGSNRPFLQQTGFHPFVSPAAGPRLQTCPVPLAVEPASYELARRYIEHNESPPPERVRTEEFLAAMEYNFRKPTRQALGLVVAGGPSPIRGEGFSLLQIGVQARQSESAYHAAKHLVFLIDTSTSMRWGSRMEMARSALGALPRMAGPEDRLSLVTFNQAAHVLVENSGGEGLSQFAEAADSLSAEGLTNIVGGLREAYGVARQSLGPNRPEVRVVLLTDGLLDLDPAAEQRIQQQVSDAAVQHIPLDVIDLGQQKQTDPQVATLCHAGQGTIHRAASTEQIRWALSEIVTGRSQVVARAARLQVTFNPKAVVEYRLIGHESREWDGLLPGPLEVDFHEGQAATALFEVRIAPNGPDQLAAADLVWYAPDDVTRGGKAPQKIRAVVVREHFAGSFTSSAPSLQAAAVAAYTAEVLRRSPFVFQPRSGLSTPAALFRAVELANQADSQLQIRPSFGEFVTLIRQELKAHPARRAAQE